MSDHDFTRVDARRYWSNVRGKIVSGWEVANEWDETDKPTHWRTLNPENREDQQLICALGLTARHPPSSQS
jgi:hypothetical protein